MNIREDMIIEFVNSCSEGTKNKIKEFKNF